MEYAIVYRKVTKTPFKVQQEKHTVKASVLKNKIV